jgi:ribosomal protein S18 acetylase RimI-like enzyme
MTKPLFRNALESDYAAICALVKSREEQFLIFPRRQWPFTVKLLHRLADERIGLTVAAIDNRVIGFANFYQYVPNHHAFIGNVVVDQAWRGRGIGRALLEYMMAKARDSYRLPEIRVSVFEHNVPAVSLYRSLGFDTYDSEVKHDPDGNRVTLVHMQHRLVC